MSQDLSAGATQQESINTSLSVSAAQQSSVDAILSAARSGNVDELYNLMRRDPDVLERFDKIPLVETPLHAAVSEGRTEFALEIMRLKPSFARKLNTEGHTVVQSALERNQTKVILRLLKIDEDLLRIQGKKGLTPLHYVAEKGNQYLLAKFLEINPKSIVDLTNQNESALHVALKYDRLNAFRFLFTWLKWTSFEKAFWWEKELLNLKDEDGNTLLHIAASKNLFEIVRWLLYCGVDKDAKNEMGDTAFDILQKSNNGTSIKDLLDRVKPKNKTPDSRPPNHIEFPFERDQKFYILVRRAISQVTDESRNVLLVVVTLLITVIFQTTVAPPGGTWQEDYYSTAANSSNSTGKLSHIAGTAIMDTWAYHFVTWANMGSFLYMIVALLILVPRGFIGAFICSPLLISLSASYITSVCVTAPDYKRIELRRYLPYSLFMAFLVSFFYLGIAVWREREFSQKFLPKEEQPGEQRQGPDP